jgi:hypothetical protein
MSDTPEKKLPRAVKLQKDGKLVKLCKKTKGGKTYSKAITADSGEELLELEKKWKNEMSLLADEAPLTMPVEIDDKILKMGLPESGGWSAVLIGASRSGKTTLLKYIMDHHIQKMLTFFTSLNDHAEIYKDLPKKTMICERYYPELIKDMYTLNHECENKYKSCFIFDDCIGYELKNSPMITKLFTIFRNANIRSVFSAQSPTLISPVGRSNANFIFLFKLNAAGDIERTIKDFLLPYLPTKMSMVEKIHFYQKSTAEHNFFFIDNLTGICIRSKLTPEQMAGKE